MSLSPEERRRIYEEEKAKIEAGKRAEQEKEYIPPETSTGIAPRVEGLLCYLGVWIAGIIFLIIEQKNKWVRFHAAQSIVVFGSLWIAGLVLGWIPFIGHFFSVVLSITGFILWIIMMVKAYNGERYKLAWAGDLAEMMIGQSADYTPPAPPPPSPGANTTPPQPSADATPSTPSAPPPAAAAAPTSPPIPPPAAPAFVETDEKTKRRVDEWFSHRRDGRITASAFAIAWDIILLVFFNYFNQYVAYYSGDTINGVIKWTRMPFFTGDLGRWLLILNTTLVISIIAHIVMILIDSDLLRQALYVIMNAFGLATVISLLVVFPFNFDVIPNSAAATATSLGVTIVLIIIAVGIGIGLLVRFIRLLISSARYLLKAGH